MEGTLASPDPDTPFPQADSVPGDSSTAASIAIGSGVTVEIETAGDHDWFAVTLTGGVTYTFQTASNGTGANPDLTLRDGNGDALVWDDDGGDFVNAFVDFTPTGTGDQTFYIDASMAGGLFGRSFHLFVATSPNSTGDTVGESIATAVTLAIGGALGGHIETVGDHDWFAVNLVAGQTYLFRTAQSGGQPVMDTVMMLRGVSGNQIAVNDDNGQAYFSGLRYTATQTGTHYLDIYGYNEEQVGAFTVTAYSASPMTLATTDQLASQLTTGYWDGAAHRFAIATGGSLTFNVSALAAVGQTLARAALKAWSEVSGIDFHEVASGGQLVFDDADGTHNTVATYGGGITTSAAINVPDWMIGTYGPNIGGYAYQIYLHEIGHALGLGHSGNYEDNAHYSTDALFTNDSWANSVMSGFNQSENGYFNELNFTQQTVLTPMVADAVAVAALYGQATGLRTGNTTYGFNNTGGWLYDAALYGELTFTIYDHGGTDTLDYSGYDEVQLIDLNEEAISNIGGQIGNVRIARGTAIENAIGGGSRDVIVGNALNNTLSGGGGNDTISGGDGMDAISGGLGTDTLNGGADGDTFYYGWGEEAGFGGMAADGDTVIGGDGVDTLSFNLTGENFALGQLNYSGIEILHSGGTALTVTGDQLNQFGGISGNFFVTGTAPIAIFGMTLLNTHFQLDSGTGGFDYSEASYTTATVTGSGDGEAIVAGDGDDTLYGMGGDDMLYGGGSSDRSYGGDGDDVIYFDDADAVIDGGAGTDRIIADGTLVAAAVFSGIEAIYLNAGAHLTVQSQQLSSGFAAHTQLSGSGTLTVQMAVNDTQLLLQRMTVETGSNVVVEIIGGGIRSTIKGVLGAENRIFAGDGNDQLRGGILADTINGGAGNDKILGFTGADILTGGAGADQFRYMFASDSGLGTAADRITDFSIAEDRLNFALIDADATTPGDQAFNFIATAAFANTGIGQIRYQDSGADLLVQIDTDGNGTADMEVILQGLAGQSLTGSNFLL